MVLPRSSESISKKMSKKMSAGKKEPPDVCSSIRPMEGFVGLCRRMIRKPNVQVPASSMETILVCTSRRLFGVG